MDKKSAKLGEVFDFILSSKKRELIGEEEIRQVKQRECWVVNNSEIKMWIDKESYLPIRINFEEKKQNITIQRAIDLFNYKT